MRTRLLAALGSLGFCLFLLTPSALAQSADDSAAQAHFTVAASYYDQGEYDSALREFQNAYALSHRAQLFYNFSLCYQQLGDLPHAIEYLERYLAEVTEVPNRTTLELRLENLRRRVATGTESGAAAELRTETETTGTETTEPEGTVTETSVTETSTETETGETETSEGTGTGTSPPPSDPGPNVGAIAGFSVAALGVVGVAIFGGLTLAENGSLSSGCGATRSCSASQTSTLQTMALLTDISFGVALAGAVVGTILLFVGGPSSGSSDTASIEVTPLAGPGLAGLSLSGGF